MAYELISCVPPELVQAWFGATSGIWSSGFPFGTPDQLAAINAVKADVKLQTDGSAGGW